MRATAVQSAVAGWVLKPTAACRGCPGGTMEQGRAGGAVAAGKASTLGRIIGIDLLPRKRCVPICQDTGMACIP